MAVYQRCPACDLSDSPLKGKLIWFPWYNPNEFDDAEYWRKPRQSVVECSYCTKKYQLSLFVAPQTGPNDLPPEELHALTEAGTLNASRAATLLYQVELQVLKDEATTA